MRVRVALTKSGDLRLGESVTAILTLKDSDMDKAQSKAGNRLLIPASALVYWQGQTGVFIRTDKSVRFTPLSVETRDEATAVVRGVLPANAGIAITGIAALKNLLSGGQ